MSKLKHLAQRYFNEITILLSIGLQQLTYLLAYNIAMRDTDPERFARDSILILAGTSLVTMLTQPLSIIIIRTRERHPTYLNIGVVFLILIIILLVYTIPQEQNLQIKDLMYLVILVLSIYYEQINRAHILWHKKYLMLLLNSVCGITLTFFIIFVLGISQLDLIIISYCTFTFISHLIVLKLPNKVKRLSVRQSFENLYEARLLITATVLFMPNMWIISEVLKLNAPEEWVVIFNYQITIFLTCCFIPLNLSKKFILDLSELNENRITYVFSRSTFVTIFSGAIAMVFTSLAYVFMENTYKQIMTYFEFSITIITLVLVLSFLIPFGNLINALRSDSWALLQNIFWCVAVWLYYFLHMENLTVTTSIEAIIAGYISMLIISIVYFRFVWKGN